MSRPMVYGGARSMWVMAMFDLPVLTKLQRRRYTRFRSLLMDDGFAMLQYSVYARPCPSEENARVHSARIKKIVPPEGEVRIILFTDLQFSRMEIFFGKVERKPEKPPEQLSFF